MMKLPSVCLFATLLLAPAGLAQTPPPAISPTQPRQLFVTYEPEGKPNGKYIVFVTGDEEYRSEEGMPQMAKILAKHHGFRCTVCFAVDQKTGVINPNNQRNIPGLENLQNAHLMVIFTRFRNLPDAQMKHIDNYVMSGRPIIGLRTSTHAFRTKKGQGSFWHYGNGGGKWKDGFGGTVLGERWVAHHGHHGRESARGIPAPGQEDHPILRGIEPNTIWDPADVYTVRLPMRKEITPIIMGQVLAGMKPDSEVLKPKEGAKRDKNNPMMPVGWTTTWKPSKDKSARVFCTTMGAARAFTQEGTRRMLVNACYWALGMEKTMPKKAKVDLVGKYAPTRFGFNRFQKGIRPASHK